MDLLTEFKTQQDTLILNGYATIAGMMDDEFIKLLEPLKAKLAGLSLPEVDMEKGTLPFVIVVKSSLVPTDNMMSLVVRESKQGIIKLFPHTPSSFGISEGVTIPDTQVYLITDIDRGKATLNVRPNDALGTITAQNRSPLTIDEGVAILTHYPEFLMKNNCFSLLASRHKGDQRVPAIWINAKKEPNLGWCWDGNPHTWLGSASCAGRI